MSGAPSAIAAIAGTGLSLIENERRTDARNAERMAEYRRERREAALEARVKRRRLERERNQALAEQRARAGAAGVGGAGGSTEAALAGTDARYRRELADLRAESRLNRPARPNLLADDTETARGALSLGREVLGRLPE